MSLLEDVRVILSVILEYFGVSPDMVSALNITSIKGVFVAYVSLIWCSCARTCSWFQCGTVSCVVPIAALFA